MKLRVGVVGLGDQWETRHAPALRALSDRYEVRAVCCEVAQRSHQIANDFQAVPMDGFQALLKRDDIQAMLALSPDWYGPIPILAACKAGKAVYSSASLDWTPEQATHVRNQIRESQIPFMAELPRRYAPATIRLKELIATRLGRPRLLFCHQRLPLESQANRLRRGQNCPLVWRYMMELVDWCRYLVGADPTSIVSSAHGHHTDGNATFYQMASLDFPAYSSPPDPPSASDQHAEGEKNQDRQISGQAETKSPPAIHPQAQLSVGHYIPQRWETALSYRRPPALQVSCERGLAFIDLPSNLIWFDDAGQHTELLDAERSVGEMMLDRFYRLLTNSIPHSTDASDAYRATKIVVAANESVQTGNRIQLDFTD